MSIAFISAQNVSHDATLLLIFSLNTDGRLSRTPVSELLVVSMPARFAKSSAFSAKTT
jgi:hypothetical protein